MNRLSELTEYEFRIYASNEAGDGPYSHVCKFSTTKAPPPAVKRTCCPVTKALSWVLRSMVKLISNGHWTRQHNKERQCVKRPFGNLNVFSAFCHWIELIDLWRSFFFLHGVKGRVWARLPQTHRQKNEFLGMKSAIFPAVENVHSLAKDFSVVFLARDVCLVKLTSEILERIFADL